MLYLNYLAPRVMNIKISPRIHPKLIHFLIVYTHLVMLLSLLSSILFLSFGENETFNRHIKESSCVLILFTNRDISFTIMMKLM